MPKRSLSFTWDTSKVSALMRRNCIRDRKHLARTISQPPTNVYESFNEDWTTRRRVVESVAIAMSIHFNVPLSGLIADPRTVRAAANSAEVA
jgi:hypothetical protein